MALLFSASSPTKTSRSKDPDVSSAQTRKVSFSPTLEVTDCKPIVTTVGIDVHGKNECVDKYEQHNRIQYTSLCVY